MNHLLKSLTASALLLFAVSCGRASDEAPSDNTSKVMSLVGYPCQEYGVNLGDNRYHCAVYSTSARTYNVLYQLEGFNDAQKNKLKQAIDIGAAAYNAYFSAFSLDANANPDLLQCVVRRADKELDPLNSKISINFTETSQKVVWAITALQFGFDFHQSRGQPLVISAYSENSANGLAPLAHAAIGNDALPANTDMNFAVNVVSLDQPDLLSVPGGVIDYSAQTFAGAIMHEMLHRKGYTHAIPGHSVGPLVYEFGNCISNSAYGLSLTGIDLAPVD